MKMFSERMKTPKRRSWPGLFRLPFVKDKECGNHDKSKTDAVIPPEFVAEVRHGENWKDRESNDFLDSLQLGGTELRRADGVRGHLETVFEEGDPPTHYDHFAKRFAAESQVAVPRR